MKKRSDKNEKVDCGIEEDAPKTAGDWNNMYCIMFFYC